VVSTLEPIKCDNPGFKGCSFKCNVYRYTTAEAKAADVAGYVAELIEGGSKLLFFAHHHVMLDAMENALKAARVPHVRIDGKTPSLERAISVRRFQEEEELRVAVLSIQACGQGITLTAAADVVFGELHWVPAAMLQVGGCTH
jgi:SWI/SNF-related matrix-associated actin-dependent regulator 1 of chromatin subfamily A